MQLSAPERAVLRAVVERILPRDEDPGALDAGAEEYLERQLDGDLQASREMIRAGLAALDATARGRAGVGFAELPADGQDALLREIEAAGFFQLLVRTTAEGFYSDPAQGGNRDAVSWRMTGFERG
jgi:gluconate 2-dehydrogenase gamma chain